MRVVQLLEAQQKLPELVESAAAGEEIVITRDDQPVARLVGSARPTLRDIQPSSVGAVMRPPSTDDDLLDEMLDQ
jgi:prevent-host-death family protein